MNWLRKRNAAHVGSLATMWIPLALAVFISYIFQRGLIIISKTELAPTELTIGVPYYLIVVGLSAGIFGLLCDNFNTRKLFLIMCFLGFLGLLLIEYSPIGFGILFGASAAMTRCGAFSGPMKLFDKNLSWNIVWQSVGKSVAPLVIPLFLLTFLSLLGWSLSIAILATIYLISGYLIYLVMPDDVMEKWNLKEVALWVKNKWFWVVFIAVMTGAYYQVFMSRMIPALTNIKYSLSDAVFIVLILGFLEIGGRFLFAWLSDKFDCHVLLCCILNPMDILLLWFVLPTYPVIAIGLHFLANGGVTPTNWPAMRKVVGAQYVSTLYGVCIFISWIIVSFLFNK